MFASFHSNGTIPSSNNKLNTVASGIQHNTRTSRKHDSQFLQIRYSTNIFGNNFFPTTIKEWNSLPPNTISSKSLKSFQNSLIQHFNN